MPAAPSTEPLPSWLYRSEAFAEDLLDEAEAEARPAPAAAGPWRRAAAAAQRGGRGLAGWLRRPPQQAGLPA